MQFITDQVAAQRDAGIESAFQIILCCARRTLEPAHLDRLQLLVRQDLDWQALVLLAARHGVAPLLYANLNAHCPQAIPTDVLLGLRSNFHGNTGENLMLFNSLVHLLRRMEENGIQAVPFKGPAMSLAAYGSLALRRAGDLDILVPIADADRAKQLLLSNGYREVSGDEDSAFHFYSKGDRFMVDLHWRITRTKLMPLVPPRDWWERRRTVAFGNIAILPFAPEEALLLSCINATRNSSRLTLSNLCDIAAQIQAYKDLDWNRVFQQARQVGSETMLCLGLRLTDEMLGITLPAQVRRRMHVRCRVFEPTLQRLCRQFFDEQSTSRVLVDRLWPFLIEDTARGRLSYVFCLITEILKPSDNDRATWRLPRYLAFLYPLLRPLRLLRRYGPEPAQPAFSPTDAGAAAATSGKRNREPTT